jgi:hypothetical protein
VHEGDALHAPDLLDLLADGDGDRDHEVTALRVTSRRGLRVSITRLKRVSALCSVQKSRMQRDMAATVLAVRMVLRRRCRRTKGRNFSTDTGRVAYPFRNG